MLQPENQNKKYNHLFTDIDTGRLKIPQFQRDFVWSKAQTAKLIDSIIKGFPIGTFILWKTQEELRHFKEIGNSTLPNTPKGETVYYVLDGQQRITSLYAVRKGIRWNKDNVEINYQDISINLLLDPDSDEDVVTLEPPTDAPFISVYKVLHGSLTEFLEEFTIEQLRKIEVYQKRLTGYDFSTIVISNYPIDIACEVFTRINTGGTELTLFEIMVAKTFDLSRKFDLAREYSRLIDNKNGEKDLEDVGFDTVSASTVLQCIAAIISKQLRRSDILKLGKTEFIDTWPKAKNGLFQAVDYVRTYQRIPVSQLIPYNSLLVPLTYFFVKNKGIPPSMFQHKMLTQYFWWASLTNRFSSATESKLMQDLERMDAILKNQAPGYRGEELELTLDDLRWRWFRTGDAFCKAILCLYASFQPHSFATNHLVNIDNSWLSQINSRNYHHFFPRAYLKKRDYPDWKANSILNITLVDDFLNKRKIGAKAPSQYINEFAKENREISNSLATHLIDDIEAFGINTDDYETFIEQRGQKILAELKKRLEPDLE